MQTSLTYVNEQDAWKQWCNRELEKQAKFYKAEAMNWPGPQGFTEGGMPVFTPADSNVRPHIKLNQDNNLYKG